MGLSTRTQHMALAAIIMSASILLSRFMGLIRDKVISWQFGASGEADLYFAAFVVPDFINYLLAGGYVSITLIPLLARRFEEDTDDAWRFFSTVLCWALLVSAALTGAAFVCAPQLALLTAPGFDAAQQERLAAFLRIILPAQVFFLTGACFSALLFLRRQFFIPALTPLIYNGAIILGGLLLPLFAPVQGMEGFCWGVTAGAALGACILPWRAACKGVEGVRLAWSWRHPLMGRFLLIALPLMLGQSIIMLNEQFLRIFGSLAGDGAVSLLSYARRISQVPVGIIGQAAAVASYPFLASLAAKNDMAGLSATLHGAVRASLLLALPLSAWLTAVAGPAMSLIFQGGVFGPAESAAATPLLQVMLVMTPFWVVQALVGRAFYALGDTRTPAIAGTVITLASLPLFYASLRWGASGIAWVSTLGTAVYTAALLVIWQKRQNVRLLRPDARLYLTGTLLATAAGAASWLVSEYCLTLDIPRLARIPLALATSGACFTACYALGSRIMAPELVRALLAPLLRRLRRRQEA